MTRKASAARMSILILIAEPQLSSPVRGMTKEPSDAETCLHVSISEANISGHDVERQDGDTLTFYAMVAQEGYVSRDGVLNGENSNDFPHCHLS